MAAKKLAKIVTKHAISPPNEGLFRIDIWPGQTRQDGFIGLGARETAATDHIVDLAVMPWPIADEVVDYISCGRYFCTLTSLERLAFLDECWRILKPQAQLQMVVPARGANHSLMDPFFQWPPVAEDFFYFANRPWREANDFAHYPVNCNFNWTYGFVLDAELQTRNEEFQRIAIKHGRNAAHELHVCLTKDT